eukprot:TRINITY_DN26968_c0_g1_i1.p1 TRINITY_DN26968_c0_g1~~TRINITY_DN26968_c0_g1_i1.p1  ORF type:complete len:235 (-),score=30.98 TRINITY_DN26968_c0_g1_i1:23-727(-)
MRLISLNCGLYFNVDSEWRKRDRFCILARVIESSDVACLQEVYDFEYFQAIQNNLRQHFYSYFASEERRAEGVAIFSRFPLSAIHRIPLNASLDPTSFSRVALSAHTHSFQIVTLHLCPHSPHNRTVQVSNLLARLPHHDRTILCGDFNCHYPSEPLHHHLYERRRLSDAAFGDATPTYLMEREKRPGCQYRLDRFYLSPPLSPLLLSVTYDIVLCSDGQWLTDHKCVRLHLAI